MAAVKIGIIKEGKVPIDRRVPLTPFQARQVKKSICGWKSTRASATPIYLSLIMRSSSIRPGGCL